MRPGGGEWSGWLKNRGPTSAVVDRVHLLVSDERLSGSVRRGTSATGVATVLGNGEANLVFAETTLIRSLATSPESVVLEVRFHPEDRPTEAWWLHLELAVVERGTGRVNWEAGPASYRLEDSPVLEA